MNNFELKGKVLMIEKLKGKGTAVKLSLEVTANNRTEQIPVLAFNKLSEVVLHYTNVGDLVEVKGALRLNNRTQCIDAVAFKVTKDDGNVNVSNESNAKKDKPTFDGVIKKKDVSDGYILYVYENLSQAAEDVKVKKSALKKAIDSGKPFAGFIWTT